MDLKAEIKNNNITLLIVPKEKYKQEIIKIIKAIESNSNKTCYVCLNEPYNSVLDNLNKNSINVEKFFFIDTLTKNVQEPPQVDNAVFISSPNALTELSLEFSKSLSDQHCDAALLDTISTLLVYEDAHALIQFVHDILTKIKVSSGKGVLIALKEDVESELVKDLYMFVDKVAET